MRTPHAEGNNIEAENGREIGRDYVWPYCMQWISEKVRRNRPSILYENMLIVTFPLQGGRYKYTKIPV